MERYKKASWDILLFLFFGGTEKLFGWIPTAFCRIPKALLENTKKLQNLFLTFSEITRRLTNCSWHFGRSQAARVGKEGGGKGEVGGEWGGEERRPFDQKGSFSGFINSSFTPKLNF